MWDDYGFTREGCAPLSAYGSNPVGTIALSAATIAAPSQKGALVGYFSVVGGTGIYTFRLTNNPLFYLLGTALRASGVLIPGSYAVTVTAFSPAGTVTQSFIVTVTGMPAPPAGYEYLIGPDGAYLLGPDGSYLLGPIVAPSTDPALLGDGTPALLGDGTQALLGS